MSNSRLLSRLTWSLSLTIMLAGFVIIVLGVGLTPAGHWSRDLVTEIGIACVSAGIVGFVYEHLLRRELLVLLSHKIRHGVLMYLITARCGI
jgi:hypothetical protein